MKHLKPRQAHDHLQQNPDAPDFGDGINVLEGFEGPLDERRQRNNVSGWRKEGLPWEQT